MSFYKTLKEEIVPPLFLIVFTSSVQILALFGKDEKITLEAIKSGLIGNTITWKIVAILFFWAYIWLIIPGEVTKGRRAPNGYLPIYKDNGLLYYTITVTVYLICQWLWPTLSTIIYDNMTQMLGTLNVIAFTFCIFLYLRSTEGSDLPQIYIFYRGRELHPTILNVQVKQLIVMRISMMFWQILVLAFLFAAWDKRNLDVATVVTCLIQTAYLFKTFIYEPKYYHTLDITLDRAGYYLIWGCLVWVPCLYAYNSYYLVKHVPIVSSSTSIIIFLFGLIAIIGTLLIDFEKARFRETNGKTLIWNKSPTFIKAEYIDESTKLKKTSLLLTSGSWGLARHLNYTLELLSNLSWALPGHGLGIPIYFFIIFLTILILHRIYRDELKCKEKYGKYWEKYCKNVPYRLIPYVI